MSVLKEKYINPFTDYGFKRLFGEEPNKDLLIDFLNELLPREQGKIKELTYLKNENLPETESERKAVFDLYCINGKGERFIVELQKAKQLFFKDRSLYYASFAIRDQAVKGANWKFELQKVYTIAILDFSFNLSDPEKWRHDIMLSDVVTHEVFYDKLMFIYLEMPKFNKTVDQLQNRYEKWLFILKNLNILNRVPAALKEQIFLKLFQTAEIAKFDKKELMEYHDSLKQYRDLRNSLDTAREEGVEFGKVQTQKANALVMIEEGFSDALILKITGLTQKELNELKSKTTPDSSDNL
jgi:predicted transposase/invertase (TIGR01784 family)